MRAVLCKTFDGPDALVIGEIEAPQPAEGEILVDVHAASVSFMDCLMVCGKYQMRPATPFVPGTDAAGVVAAIGEGVTRFRPGDRVACSHWTGAYGEAMVVPEFQAVPIPEALYFATASTVLHTYVTAHYALHERAAMKPGEQVFVTGAAGGVGLAAVDYARHLGAKVIASVGSAEKLPLVRRYGAYATINYRTENVQWRGSPIDRCRGGWCWRCAESARA